MERWKLHFQCFCDLVVWHVRGLAAFGSQLMAGEHNTRVCSGLRSKESAAPHVDYYSVLRMVWTRLVG